MNNRRKKTMIRIIRMWLLLCCLTGITAACKTPPLLNVEPKAVPPVEITTESLPPASSGDDYSATITARGGSGRYLFTPSALPDGLKLSRKGKLNGFLGAKPGEYTFIVTVSDKKNPVLTFRKDFSLTVHPPVVFHDSRPAPVVLGMPYSWALHMTGGSGPLALSCEGLPLGLSMDESGVVSGVASGKPGTYSILLTAKDSGPLETTLRKKEKILVYPALDLVCDVPGLFVVGSRLETRVRANGGSGEYRFSSPDLPQCLTLDDKGRIRGNLDLERGVNSMTVHVDDVKAGIHAEKKLGFKVVDYLPDDYESMDDDGFQSKNTMVPGSSEQYHTFDEPGDRDVVRLDLTNVAKDSVLMFRANPKNNAKQMTLSVLDPNGTRVVGKKGIDALPVFMRCEKPGIYHAVLETLPDETGEMIFSMSLEGPGVNISTETLNDVSTLTETTQTIQAVHGSGSFRFTPLSVPQGLVLLEDGTLKGVAAVDKGEYEVKIRVEDRIHTGITHEKTFALHVVDYFPDAFEQGGDLDFTTANVMKPGDTQHHTFNTETDEDTVRLDLSGTAENHVIHVETRPLSSSSRTDLTVYDSVGHVTLKVSDMDCASVYLIRKETDPVYLKIRERNGQTGDYALSVSDKGPKVAFKTDRVPDALSKGPNEFQFTAEGGSGRCPFSGRDLPGGLVLTEDGRLHGNLDLAPGQYPFTVSVNDPVYSGTGSDLPLVLTVVDYFPDSFEAAGDSDVSTACTLKPDGAIQNHTLHTSQDLDMIRLDFETLKPDDVVRIIVTPDQEGSGLSLEMLDKKGEPAGKAVNREPENQQVIIHQCVQPGSYYLRIRHPLEKHGAYTVKVDHCGPRIRLAGTALPFAESDLDFSTTLSSTGGETDLVFSVSDGHMPDGLVLDETTGRISGRNKTWGHFTFNVTAHRRLFPENSDTREFGIQAYMGRKLRGTTRVQFPHYVSGAYSMDSGDCTSTAFPGKIEGGTPGNLRYSIASHNIPPDRFDFHLAPLTGLLSLKERQPVSCKEYQDLDLYVDVDVLDSVCSNNRLTVRYEIPVRCLDY